MDALFPLGKHAARQHAPAAWRWVEVEVAEEDATFRYRLRRDKIRKCVGANRYLLRLTETDPAKLRRFDSRGLTSLS